MLGVAVILILLGVFFTYVERHVVAFWDRVRLGLAILTTPRRYFRRVVPLQLLGWCCRIAAMYWFLAAFRVPAGVVTAALALAAQSASTLLPLTPGGVGTQQALLGYMFRECGRDQPRARLQRRHAVRDHARKRRRRRPRDLAHAAPAAVEGAARRGRLRRRPVRDKPSLVHAR